jgi:hypothetical protein
MSTDTMFFNNGLDSDSLHQKLFQKDGNEPSNTPKLDKVSFIPVLNDRCDSLTSKISSDSKHRNNPFLPYETLERLAEEREQFKEQLAEFGHHFEMAQPLNQRTATQSPSFDELKTECIESLIKETTATVLSEYQHEIELEILRRVKQKLLVD